jgi:hypothetical protein
VIIFGVLIQQGWGQEQEHYFIAVSTLVARPLGMGGAFTAVDDDLAALLYNPASFSLYKDHRTNVGRVTLFLNPVAPVVALQQPSALFGRSYFTWEEVAAIIGMLIKGMTLSLSHFEVSALLGEQSPQPERFSTPQIFDAHGYLDNHYNILAARMHMAERVSLGGSIGLYYSSDEQRGRKWGVGTSYGVLMRPGRDVSVGVSYITLPEMQRDYREDLERIVSGALNFGMSVRFKFGATVAADIRNLGEEKAVTGELIREAHLGLEQILLPHIALRAGLFRKRHEEADDRYALSAGLGLADGNGFWSPRRRFGHRNWVINYGVVAETLQGQHRFYHALSMIFRL